MEVHAHRVVVVWRHRPRVPCRRSADGAQPEIPVAQPIPPPLSESDEGREMQRCIEAGADAIVQALRLKKV